MYGQEKEIRVGVPYVALVKFHCLEGFPCGSMCLFYCSTGLWKKVTCTGVYYELQKVLGREYSEGNG